MRHRTLLFNVAAILASTALFSQAQSPYRFQVTDLRSASQLVILLLGDSGTGEAGQYRVGDAMATVCHTRGCDFALMLGDNVYENGIKVTQRDNAQASFREILAQFDAKFEQPYKRFDAIDGFHFWAVLGNHDYRKNTIASHLTYSEFSELWRMPGFHYEIPLLPDWVQIYGLHTDTDERRDLNGLQIESAKRALCSDENPDRWKIVFGHQPAYNSGHHSGDGNERRTRALLEPSLLDPCGVHFYIAGHAHHQEHLTLDGFEQVIQGAAAKSKGRNGFKDSPGIKQRHFSREFGFAVLELNPGAARLDFYDVLNTREKGPAAPLRPDEIVRAYSWCGFRVQVGRVLEPAACTPASGLD